MNLRKGPKRGTIARTLPLSVGTLVIVVTGVMTAIAYVDFRRSLLEVASQRLSGATKQLQGMLEQSAQQTYVGIATAASRPELVKHAAAPSAQSAAAVVDLLTKQRPSPTTRAIEVWDNGRTVQLSSAPAVPAVDSSTRAALLAGIRAEPGGFSSAYRVVGDTLESSAIVAIREDSVVRGFLVVRRRLGSSAGVRQLTELIGSNARLIVGSRAGDVWTDLVAAAPGVPREFVGDQGITRYTRVTGERVLARVLPVASTEWLLAVEFLEAPILAPATRFLTRAVIIALLLGLTGALVSIRVSRRITDPLEELRDAATALANGADSTRVAVTRSDEIGELSASFNGMAEQITLAQARLARAFERYRLLFDRNPIPMWVFEKQSLAFVEVNEAAIRDYGYSREEFLAMTLRDIRPAGDVAQLESEISRPIEGLSRTSRWEHRRKDGSTLDVEVSRTDFELQGKELSFALAADITARMAAERAVATSSEALATSKERIEVQLGRLKALRAIDLAILSTTDRQTLLKSVLREVMEQLRADVAAIFLLNPHTLTVDTSASMGYRTRAAQQERVRLGDGVAGRAARERRTIGVPDLSALEMSENLRQLAGDEGIRSVYAVPLIAKGQLIGVLDVMFRQPFAANDDWLEFCEALAGQTAMAIESSVAFEELQRSNLDLSLAYEGTIEGWSRALDLRDRETEGHTQRVTEMTERLARLAGIREAELVQVRRGALLHDIGKMGIPDSILLKPGPLTDDEWVIMRQHPDFAVRLLSPIDYLRGALDIPYCHHENWDGTGYPRGLRGEQIPLSVRLFSVVDVWDALRSDRPYRAGWPQDRVISHIRGLAGEKFDPRAVEIFLQALREDRDGHIAAGKLHAA